MQERDLRETFHDLLQRFDYGMFVTYNNEHSAHIRPMAVAQVDKNCDVWLFTAVLSGKVDEVAVVPDASITFQRDPSLYLVLTGTAQLVQDQEKARDLWDEAYRVWFPEGPTDSNLMLIHLRAMHGEFWDNTGTNRINYAYEFVRGYLTGERPRMREGEQHGTVTL